MPRIRKTSIAIATALCMAAGASVPASAAASSGLETSIQDDNLLLHGDTDGALSEWARMGVDRVRVNLIWDHVAPAATERSRPEGFAAENHSDSGYSWASYDRVLNAVRAHGLKLHVTITGPGPIWASLAPERGRGQWKPSRLEFARFTQAAATRYGSLVDLWGIYNEPNQGGWLQPQSVRGGSGWELYAPHYYRGLVRSAYPQIKRADPSSRVLVGELAPSGRDSRGHTRPIRPLSFIRTMGCVSSRYSKRRTGRCRGFRPATGGGFAHHPYPIFKSPRERSRERSDAALGDTRRLLLVLDRVQRRNGLRKDGAGRFSVWYTEYGYQTNPPDRFAGVSTSRQSIWMQQSQYEMWRQPRVRSWTQYLYRDERDTGGFQTGMLDADGRAKLYRQTFSDPFWVSRSTVRRGSRVRFWGQYKPGAGHSLTLEYRNRGSSRWRPLARVETNSRGHFAHTRTVRSTRSYRFRHPDGTSSTRTVRVR